MPKHVILVQLQFEQIYVRSGVNCGKLLFILIQAISSEICDKFVFLSSFFPNSEFHKNNFKFKSYAIYGIYMMKKSSLIFCFYFSKISIVILFMQDIKELNKS